MKRALFGAVLRMVAAGLILVSGVSSNAAESSGQTPPLAGSEAFKNVKVLNNLCWELLSIERPEGLSEPMNFSAPLDRWIVIQSHAEAPLRNQEVSIAVDSDVQPALVHRESGDLEAMRYLKAGAHVLKVNAYGGAKITRIVVRAIPELQHACYGEDSLIAPFGPFDWKFLEKDVLPNVNVMVYNRHVSPRSADLGSWNADGRVWIADADAAWELFDRGKDGKMSFKGKPADAAEAIYSYWVANTLAVRHPLVKGLMIDEMVGPNIPVFDAFLGAAQKLYEDPRFNGKVLDLYAGGPALCMDERGRALARFCVDHGGTIEVEWYLLEEPTLAAAATSIEKNLVSEVRRWETALPGITPHVVATLACESAPSESADRYPHVDFKVFMDMQMRTLATHPDFFGLGGIQWYKSGYSDEEVLRWTGRLYRHYCIEGKTEPLTQDPYELSHIRNADFAEGMEDWEIRPADDNSAQPKSCKAYGVLQGRWGSGMGDTFLWTKRSANRPNVFTQQIRNLEPGRLYSMKMITSDYQDLYGGKSEKKQLAVSIQIENVERLAAPHKSFQFAYPNSYDDNWTSRGLAAAAQFNEEHPYWLNYHRVIFRAKAPTAKLTVMDWRSEDDSGGPIGQELMFNFIQIQPYVE
jgi:hypothetical protein